MKTITCGIRSVHYAKKHHHVLEAWARHRRATDAAPHLVTLDFHTDLRPAFTRDCCLANPDNYDIGPAEIAQHAAPLLTSLSGLSVSAVKDSIARLTYEEHVDAAQGAGIIDHVFLLLTGPEGYEAKANQIIHQVDTDDPAVAAATLEPATLDPFVKAIETTTGKALEDLPYILDIDLDAFRSAAAIKPTIEASFRRLIRNAALLTVALEPGCVRECRLPGEAITSASLFQELQDHMKRA